MNSTQASHKERSGFKRSSPIILMVVLALCAAALYFDRSLAMGVTVAIVWCVSVWYTFKNKDRRRNNESD